MKKCNRFGIRPQQTIRNYAVLKHSKQINIKYRPPLQAIYSHFPLGIYTKRNYSVLGSFRCEANIQDEIIYNTTRLSLRNKQFLPQEHIYISERNEKYYKVNHASHPFSTSQSGTRVRISRTSTCSSDED